MCILFVYLTPNPTRGKYRLIIATNRDEYFERPAEPVHKWLEDENVLAGKDLQSGREGGTWFGISLKQNESFKFRAGVLLNVTGEPRLPHVSGRGCVVTDYLRGDLTAIEYAEFLKNDQRLFNGFSFIGIELGSNLDETCVVHHTNMTKETLIIHDRQILAYSNSLPNEPFRKVNSGAQRFQEIIESLDDVTKNHQLIEQLLWFLKWDACHLPDEVLRRSAPDIANQLSCIFVNIPEIGYGTRTHSIVLVDFDGHVEFVEDTMECPPKEVLNPNWSERRLQATLKV